MFEKTNHTITITKVIIVKQQDIRLTTYTCTCTCMYTYIYIHVHVRFDLQVYMYMYTRLQFCYTIKQHYSVV